jgi:hypothetical protein
MHRIALPALLLGLAALTVAPAAAQTLFGFSLDEGQEVPPTGSPAVGDCVAQLDAFESTLTITCGHDVSGATMAHIHNAPAGMNGGIVFPFPAAASPIHGVWELTPADVTQLEAGNLYVNVHSGAFPDGEIRGQITAPAAEAYSFSLDEGQEVPPTGSSAIGVCDAVLNGAETELTIACQHDVAGPTMAHIHNAAVGMNGGIVFPFPAAASPMFGVWSVTAGNLVELRAERLYVNVHSGAFPDGEIRGQVLPAADVIFGDGLETGDTDRWDSTVE